MKNKFYFYILFISLFAAASAMFYFNERLGETKMARAIGIETQVQENPYNKLDKQLKEKDQALSTREENLEKIGKEIQKSNRNRNLLLTAIAVFVVLLFFLIIFNYYLDYKRRRDEKK